MTARRSPVLLLILGALTTGFAALGLYWQQAQSPSVGSIDHQDAAVVAMGQEIYAAHCASCHGANLEGQPNWRERLANGRLPAPPHDENGHTWHHSDQQLFELTKFGTAAFVGGDYESDMQGYADVLRDDEILAVLAFIKSSWSKEIRGRNDEINNRAPN